MLFVIKRGNKKQVIELQHYGFTIHHGAMEEDNTGEWVNMLGEMWIDYGTLKSVELKSKALYLFIEGFGAITINYEEWSYETMKALCEALNNKIKK